MNQNLIQINDNYGAVSDENGNISIISKDNQEYDLQDILTKENELEILKSRLNTEKKELSTNKMNMIFGEIMNGIVIGGEIVLYYFLHSTLPTSILLFLMSLIYIITKGITLIEYGTRIGRITKKKKLNASIEELESKIPELEKELCEMKQKTNYKINYQEHCESKTISQVNEAYQCLSAYMEHNINEEPTQVKVLRLSRKK